MLCPACQRESGRFGRTPNGSQRYRCASCARTFVDESTRAPDRRRVAPEKIDLALRLLLEGTSIRALERQLEINRNTIMGTMVEAGEKCRAFIEKTVKNVAVSDVQADEIWGFVGMKEKTRLRLNREECFGDVWCFTAVERHTKLILTYHVGKRTPTDTTIFAENLCHATQGRFQLTTDGFTPYRTTIPAVLGGRVDFATLVKVYGDSADEGRYVRADWFVFAAARPPLYHDVLELPKTDLELEKQLRVDVAENIRTEEVARAAFNGSGVSRNNRLIERHKSPYGAYWKSDDFASNVGRKNLFQYPLGPGNADNLFKHDGGEIIFNLPNGLQAYFLTDGDGKRIDKGPINIVSDPKQADRSVVNGISCMTCHNQGMLVRADQIRAHVEKNPEGFTRAEAETIKALYPPKADFEKLLKKDAERFRKAVEASGAHLSKTEPVYALSGQFEKEIDIKFAAAEVGVSETDFGKGLGRSANLARVFGTLRVEGGTVQRQVLVEHFGELATVLLPDGQFRRGLPDDKILTFDLGNNVKLEMVRINAKGKTFSMGSKEEASGREVEQREKQREVSFDHDFFMGKFEVTQEQYEAIMGTNPSDYKGAKNPVGQVSWNNAQECIKKLNGKFKDRRLTFRLPSEAEWEYACRAGTTTPFHFGETISTDQANYYGESVYGNGKKGVFRGRPVPVGSFAANACGLYDMHGNGFQWCEDWYDDKYYNNSPKINPVNIKEGFARVVRGGGFSSFAGGCRSANRYTYKPSDRGDSLGFRVVRSSVE